MRTKAVYVLTSTPEDFYYEQLFISVYSLKYYNPEMTTVLVTDESTNSTFGPGRCNLKEYFDEIVVVDIPKQFDQMQCSRYLKTTLRKRVTGDFLFIDTDTIIAAPLDEIDSMDCEMGAVPNNHKVNSHYYNSGVIFSKDTQRSHELYELWHSYWLEAVNHGSSRDQQPLEKANMQMNSFIHEISGSWNCQILTKGKYFLNQSKIIHCFVSFVKYEYIGIFFNKISYCVVKEFDGIPDVLKQAIKQPVLNLQNTYWGVSYYLMTIFRYYPRLFKCIDCISCMCFYLLEGRRWLIYKITGRYPKLNKFC